MKAVLVKRDTDDGLMGMRDDVPLGRTYEVDPSTEMYMRCFHTPTGQWHTKRMVRVEGGDEWLPVDLLAYTE